MAHRKVLISIGYVTVGLVFGKIAAFLKHFIIVKIYNISIITDAFFIANTLNEIFINIVLAGLITGAFIPIASRVSAENGYERFRIFSTTAFNTCGILFVITATALFFFAEQLALILAPTYGTEQLRLVSNLIRIFAPGIFFIGLAVLLTGILQTHEDFRTPSFGFFVHNGVTILFTVFFYKYWGIYAAAIGTTVGFAGWFFIQIPHSIKYLKKSFKIYDPLLAKVAKIAIPIVLIILLSNMILVIEKVVASDFSEGTVSQLNLGLRLVVITSNLLILPVSTVLLPRMSKYAGEKNYTQLFLVTKKTLEHVSFVLFVALPSVVLNAKLLTYIVYYLTGVGSEALDIIADYFRIYAFAFIGIFYYMILLRLFYSVQRIKELLLANAVGFLCYIFTLYFKAQIAEQVLPLAYATFYWASTLTLMIIVKLKVFKSNPFPIASKIIITGIIVSAISVLIGFLIELSTMSNFFITLILAISITYFFIKYHYIDLTDWLRSNNVKK